LTAVLFSISAASPVGAQPTLSCSVRIVPSPNLGTRDNFLNGVSVVSTTDAWAVGYYYATETYPFDTLVLHWDGADWSVVDSPSPGDVYNILNGVSALSPTDAWAVGYTQDRLYGGHIRSLILHWDGAAWSEVHVRLPKDQSNSLNAVHAIASDDVWAVGSIAKPGPHGGATLALHWDGSTWQTVPSPNEYDPLNGSNDNYLWSVDAASSSDVWSVGNFGDFDNAFGDNSTLSLHWNGSRWTKVKSPNPKPINYFRGVSVLSSTEIWAVGYKLLDRYAMPRALAATNDGQGWTIVPTDSLPSTYVYSVDAVSSDEVWIGGIERPAPDVGANPAIDIWNGTEWTVLDQPDISGTISGIASPGPGQLWAVGTQISFGTPIQTLIERASCS
jgi:hypothetical protein